MDKYETSLNEFHQTIWDDLKFPIENVMNERMLKIYNKILSIIFFVYSPKLIKLGGNIDSFS